MMKSILSLILLLAFSANALAYDFMVDGLCYDICSGGDSVIVTYRPKSPLKSNYDSLKGDIVIPQRVKHNGKFYTVVQIGIRAFSGCVGMTSVAIPNSVTEIGSGAFYGCSNLTSVTIPNSVTEMALNPFRGCTNLVSIDVEPTNTTFDSRENCNAIIETATNSLIVGCKNTIIPSSVKTIGSMAFRKCIGLTSVAIPDSVTEIGSSAFSGCTGLTSVAIPNSVTEIGSSAFSDCTGLTSVKLPDSVSKIDIHAFLGCTGLTSVKLPDSITEISGYAFSGCTGLTSVTIPNSVTKIDSHAFDDCTGLISVTIPNSVTEISGSAFNGCTGLTSVKLPDSVTEIGSSAFSGCTGLTSVAIPNSVTEIGSSAFSDCTGLTSVKLPDSITEISGYAFSGCTGLTSIKFPDSLTKIDSHAFDDCTGLISVTIPNSVTEISGSAFNGCTGLTSVKLPDSMTKIGGYAFSGCTGLTSVAIPDSVTEIGSSAFSDCTGLTSVKLPDSITEIGSSAFSGCTGLTSVKLPDSVTEIGSSAFDHCTNLSAITIPSSVTWIGSSIFSYCDNLVSINVEPSNPTFDSRDNCNAIIKTATNWLIVGCKNTKIPATIKSIAPQAFYNCTELTSVNIPNSVTFIGGRAFEGCIGLTSMTISNSLTAIFPGVFKGCTGLTSVTIPESVSEISNGAFEGCTGLTSVTIPNSVTKIGSGAFKNCINLESIVCAIEAPQNISTDISAFNDVNKQKCKLLIPRGSLESYKSVAPWRYFKMIKDLVAINDTDTVKQDPLSLRQKFQQYYNKEQYGRAIQIGERLLAQKDFATDSAYALMIEQLADCYYKKTNYNKAKEYYEMLDLNESHNYEAASINEKLGDCCRAAHDYKNAVKNYSKAYNIYLSCDTSIQKYSVTKMLLNIHSCHIAQGKYLDAIEPFLEFQSIRQKNEGQVNSRGLTYLGDQYNQVMRQNLSLIVNCVEDLCIQNRYCEALGRLDSATVLYQKITGEKSHEVAVMYERIGRCYLLSQQYARAQEYLNQAKDIFEKNGLNLYSSIYYRNLFYNDPLLSSMMIEHSSYYYPDLVGDLILDYGIYYASRGGFGLSLMFLNSSLNSIHKECIHYLSNNASEDRSTYWRKYSSLFCQIYPYVLLMDVVLMADTAKDNKFSAINLYGDLYNKSALFAKGLLLASDNEFSRTISESGDSILISRYEELEALRSVPGPHTDEQNKMIVDEARALERELISISKDYREFTDNLKLEWTDVQARLRPDDIAIEFLSFPKLGSDSTLYIALTVRKDYDRPHMVFLGEENELNAAAKKAYTSNELSKLIWGKLSNELKGGEKLDTVRNIYFSPSGMLHQVAIESMPHWVNTVSLMNQCYNIYRLSSTRELVIERNSIQSDSAAVYGDIEYSTPVDSMGTPRKVTDESSSNGKRGFDANSAGYRGKEWKELEYSKPEINSITSILESKKIDVYKMAQKDATETSFKDLSKQKKNIIHISTHGFCWNDSTAREKGKNRTKPLSFLGNGQDAMTRSGLLFSGANHCFADGNKKSDSIPEGVDDGVLTAYEASQLDLRDLDLLVLSACETGLGDISAEGVFGLQRGFKKAGARSIIMSLWEVNDLATSEMMTKFYKYWIEYGVSKHEAFLEAQKDIKNKYGNYEYKDGKPIEPTDKPYWAAFILLDATDN